MENISNLIVTAVAIIGAITAAIIGGLAIWTFRDIRSRSRDFLVQTLATVMVAVIPVAGILVYFMLRPRETLAEAYVRALEEESLLASIEHQEFCPACGRRVDPDMVFCPSCHGKLRNPCPSCHRAVHLSWDLCPYCGGELQPEMPVVGKVRRRNIPAAPAQPATPLPASTPQPTNTLLSASSDVDAIPGGPAANSRSASTGFVNVLDKVGGAIEGLVDRISTRSGNVEGTANAARADEEEPRQEPYTAPPKQVTRAYPRSAQSNPNRQDGTPPSAGGIKPLISREEPLE